MQKIIIGTKNRDKSRELRALLGGGRVRVLSLEDFAACPDVVEDGRTFEANAAKKARIYSKFTGLLTLADDSGLEVSALKGRPGVYSARFAGKGCAYRDNNRKLLKLLKGIPARGRGAKFICVAALYDKGKCVAVVRGECPGAVAFVSRGRNGFGYDPVFIPKGFKRTFAELSAKVKNRISHRGKALGAAKRVILAYLAGRRDFSNLGF